MENLEAVFGPNTALVEELFEQYKQNPDSVPEYWKNYFDEIEGKSSISATSGLGSQAQSTEQASTPPTPASSGANGVSGVGAGATQVSATEGKKPKAAPKIPESASVEKIKGVASKIVENMDESLTVPTATSLRVIPVKMLSEDRTIINKHLTDRLEPKASFTHFIAWAVIRALKEFHNLNRSYTEQDGAPMRVDYGQVNLGIAVDVANKDGSRNLVVPNIKGVDKMNFREFLYAYADIVEKARTGKLEISDFQQTTISITNPGTLGTVSSVPRLMTGQGAIIATGAIDYPAEYQFMSQEVLNQLGVSKVMTLTCTYDHRIIQGAESGLFLQKVHSLLNGMENFYDQIFYDLEIPYEPLPSGGDTYSALMGGGRDDLEEHRRAIAVWRLIFMYRIRGHGHADIDPLRQKNTRSPELDLEYFNLSIWDLDREFYCGGLGGKEKATLREIVQLLRETYCSHIGAEYMHILDLKERRWLRERMESTLNRPNLNKEEKKTILHKLNQAMAFEQFLHKKYVGHKRFSLEGADTVIPMMHFMLEEAGKVGVEKFFLGMAHRGRLNVLVNILQKPYQSVFAAFEGNVDPTTIQGSGDVKYHLGARGTHKTDVGQEIDLELLPNPSHLESVNPVVEGAVRATQDYFEGEDANKKIIPFLIHGDAAFAGQGVVAETLNMSLLKGYKVGGTIHLVINNQIGFTTLPEDGRSTQYASDLAKTIIAPIFHVNGDQPEAAIHTMKLALEYRQKFGKDVVIDLICYRKHGHNEGDEPAFTQPGMYKEIETHATVRDHYMNYLLKRGDFTQEEVQKIFDEFEELLNQAFDNAKATPALEVTDQLLDRSESVQKNRDVFPDTKVSEETLHDIAVKLNTVPKDFDANPKLLKQLAKRAELAASGEQKIDWGFAEGLAFGSLLVEGTPIRLTGQDVERGTFSHRHAKLHGTETNQSFVPLNHLKEGQAPFYNYNSLLSEFAAMGFEFGYSASKLDALVIWEAQFGDFANGAQIIIDQYLAASEAKWGQKSALVLNLPHGYEGQGPEHSSARLERFLQLAAEDNIQVMNLTTPTQYFHALRKQVKQASKKPMVIMTPKSLLRHPKAVSSISELASGSFQPVLRDEAVNASSVKRVIFSVGKVYYDLLEGREQYNLNDSVAIIRVEQLYPFPDEDIRGILAEFSNAGDIVWAQEEPKNMGSWFFGAPRMVELLGAGQKLHYAGRPASASPAAGQMKVHQVEQENLMKSALGV